MTQSSAPLASLCDARFTRSPLPQAVLDPSGRFQHVNNALCELLGRAAVDLLGRRPTDMRHPSDPGEADRKMASLLAGDSDTQIAQRIFAHRDGRAVPVRVHAAVIVDDEARRQGIAGFIHDLTDLYDVEQRLRQQETFYRVLGEQSGTAVIIDSLGTLVYVPPSVNELLGYPPDDLVATTLWDHVHPEDIEDVRRHLSDLTTNGGVTRTTFRARAADATWRWIDATGTNLTHTAMGGILCSLLDVTAEHESRAQLGREQARNKGILEAAQEGVWVIDSSGRTEYVNARMADLLGMPIERLYEIRPADLVTNSADRTAFQVRVGDRARRGPERYELTYPHPDGSERCFQISAAPLNLPDGSFFGSIAMVSDVTETRKLVEDLRHAVLHDPLTGLPNRVLLHDRLNQASLTQQQQGGFVSILIVDIDQFKLVNDTHGHGTGDQILVEVARRLQRQLRPQDTVARRGGDEFIVLIVDDDEDTAARLAEDVIQVLEMPISLHDRQVSISASVGIASSPPYDEEGLLQYADTALFAAKASGPARARMFDRELADEAQATVVLGTALRDALKDEALDLHYQPIIELATGHTLGYEALARWSHAEHGPVPPATFVELAQRIGIESELDAWALGRASHDYADLRHHDPARPAYVAVNLSATQLEQPDFAERLDAITSAAQVPPEKLVLEITERSFLRDTERSRTLLRRLRGRGHPIAVDDFGTGYSALAYLRTFPISIVKIDRMFVADAVGDPDALAIVSSIIQLATAIGAATVAEGIETAEQAALLADLGCTAGQGWLWSKAVPLDLVSRLPRQFPRFTATGSRVRSHPPARRLRILPEHGLYRMLQLQREGASLTSIAAALNNEGFRTPDGQRWHRITVARALVDIAE